MLKKNFTRRNLAEKINKKIGISKNFSLSLVDSFFTLLTNELTKANKMKVASFGTFKVQNKKERVGRNPKTKIEAKISSRKVIKFKPSVLFKQRINN